MYILSKEPSIANQFISELRSIHIQKDRMRFRKNLERLGEILAYEISKTMDYKVVEVETPLAISSIEVPIQQPVIIAVLRASLPFYQGFLNFFDKAESGFIGAFREEKEEGISIKYRPGKNIFKNIVNQYVNYLDLQILLLPLHR